VIIVHNKVPLSSKRYVAGRYHNHETAVESNSLPNFNVPVHQLTSINKCSRCLPQLTAWFCGPWSISHNWYIFHLHEQ